MSDIFGKPMYPSLAEWCDIIEDKLEDRGDEPIWNVAQPEVDGPRLGYADWLAH